MGSSPLARGLLQEIIRRQAHGRIIPARAGFTPRADAVRPPTSDHPRSRGVYRGSVVGAVLEHGSSPLARGLHRATLNSKIIDRIIPARAGFTW